MHSFEETSDLTVQNRKDSGLMIPRPNLEFEGGTHSIFQIIQKFPFPVVVLPVDRLMFNFDLGQPLLFYRKRSIQKIPARTLFVDENDQYREAGDPLLVPEDYKGYFAILKRRISGTTDSSSPHFTKIEDIAQSDTETFLIGGQARVKGFQVANQKGVSQIHEQRILFPGDVLCKIKLYTLESRRKSKILRRNSIITEKFLLCTDETGREVVLPFEQMGIFYALKTTSGSGTCPVMQMSEIVSNKYLPCVAKLIHGRVPTTPCFFSGLLQLDAGYLEQSIVAATMMKKNNILIEIPSTCKMEFSVAHTTEELISHQGYLNAVQLCTEQIHSYMRNIKVCLSCKPEESIQRTGSQGAITIGDSVSQVPVVVQPLDPPKPCSKDANRDSGYMRMTLSTDDLATQVGGSPDHGHDTYVRMSHAATSPSSPPPDYVLKMFIENKFMEVPVYRNGNTEISDSPDFANTSSCSSGADNGSQHMTTPPDLPPPPVPCSGGTPPSLSGGSPSQDSGISDIGLSEFRLPSTMMFAANDQNPDEDSTYDIPQIPTRRRISAPPKFDLRPAITDCKPTGLPTSSPLNKRKGHKNRVSSAPSEMLRLVSPTETIHEHEFQAEYPRYENIEGMKEIEAKLIQHQTLTDVVIGGNDVTQPCFPWQQGTYNTPPRCSSAGNGSSDESSPYYISPHGAGMLPPNPRSEYPNFAAPPVCSLDTADSSSDGYVSQICHDTFAHDYLTLLDGDNNNSRRVTDNIYNAIQDEVVVDPPPRPHRMIQLVDLAHVAGINSDIMENQLPPLPHRTRLISNHSYCNTVPEDDATGACNNDVTTACRLTEGNVFEGRKRIENTDIRMGAKDEKECGKERSSLDSSVSSVQWNNCYGTCNPVEQNTTDIHVSETNRSEIQESTNDDCKRKNTSVRNISDSSVASSPQNEGYVVTIGTESVTQCGDVGVKCQCDNGEDHCEDLCHGNFKVLDQSRRQDFNMDTRCMRTDKETQLKDELSIHVQEVCPDIPSRRSSGKDETSDKMCAPTADKIKLPPPCISPKPIRTNSEKKYSFSEEPWTNLSTTSEHSSHSESTDDQPIHHNLKHRERTESNSVYMSTERLEEELKNVGVTRKSRTYISDNNVKMEDLLNMDVEELQKDLPGVCFLDLRKIAMIIRQVLARSTNH